MNIICNESSFEFISIFYILKGNFGAVTHDLVAGRTSFPLLKVSCIAFKFIFFWIVTQLLWFCLEWQFLLTWCITAHGAQSWVEKFPFQTKNVCKKCRRYICIVLSRTTFCKALGKINFEVRGIFLLRNRECLYWLLRVVSTFSYFILKKLLFLIYVI